MLDYAIEILIIFFFGKRQNIPYLSSQIYRPHLVVKDDDEQEYLGVCFSMVIRELSMNGCRLWLFPCILMCIMKSYILVLPFFLWKVG